MQMAVRDYQSLITSQHKTKEKFRQTIELSTNPYADIQDFLLNLNQNFSLDSAVGNQLDILGEWVGISRYVDMPLSGIYFSWDTILDEGWDAGKWKDEYDPSTGITKLDDDSYRYLLKMQVAANHWNGTKDAAYDIWHETFGNGKFLVITDFQNMSIELGFAGEMPSTIKAIIKGGIQPFKPESVRVGSYFVSNNDGALFGWDIATEAINGWDIGYYAEQIAV